MGSSNTPIDDIAYLARSEHRASTLAALTVRPRSRSELCELGGVSSSTVRRMLREFSDRGWVERDEYQYEATELGAAVASAMVEAIDRIETVHEVQDVWEYLPGEEHGFSIGMCGDAVVTVPDSDEPYRPVHRFRDLLEQSDRLRAVGFEVAIFDPCKEQLCRRVSDGMETELIAPPRMAEYIRSHCPELVSETLETGNLTLRLHDDLPHFGVCLFDERISIRGYDSDAVTLRVLVDTEDPEAREWAESIYSTYQRETPTIPLETVER